MKQLPFNAQYVLVAAATTAAAKAAIAAVSGSRHRIMGLVSSAVSAQNITLQSSTGGIILGPIYLAAGGAAVLPPEPMGYCVSALSKAVLIQHDAAVATRTQLIYSTYSATA